MTRALACGAFSAALALAACGGGESPDTATSAESEAAATEAAATEVAAPTELDVENVATRLAGGEDIFLLDVRTPEELVQDGAIEGYTHIPIDELEGRLAEVPRDKPIVAY